ncbi:MAG: SMP-30/gluconolactonase/LRE family protein, partial [Ramlibacter sp.]
MNAELVVDARDGVGESPVWSVAEQALYWVDIPGRKLQRWQAGNGLVEHWGLPEQGGCIAARSQGGWLCAMESGVFQLEPGPQGALQTRRVASIDHACDGMRFNDGRCDRQGRLRAGTMLADMAQALPAGALYSLEPGGVLRALVKGLIVPNGLAFSPDGRTMYLSDSHPTVQAIWAFDYDTGTGTPSNRRLFVDMTPLAGRPDGAAVDADGCYWICGNDAGLVHRFTPDG